MRPVLRHVAQANPATGPASCSAQSQLVWQSIVTVRSPEDDSGSQTPASDHGHCFQKYYCSKFDIRSGVW
jgi:hypothetical protein